MPLLGYSKWANVHKVGKNVMLAYENSNYDVKEQPPEFRKPITCGNGNIQNVIDYRLSRYACYLIVQNANTKKESIANKTHYEVGKKVRNIIKKLSADMPEGLPT